MCIVGGTDDSSEGGVMAVQATLEPLVFIAVEL